MKCDATNEVNNTLDTLAILDRSALAKQWTDVFGCPAPRNCQATFLLRALAWHYQMARLKKGGANGVGRLHRELQRSAASSTKKESLTPGTRLLREWQGQTHHVTVLVKGFEYADKHYRSLTAISRHITGTAWSGPQFFGLRL